MLLAEEDVVVRPAVEGMGMHRKTSEGIQS
jgi:hypothetical protein